IETRTSYGNERTTQAGQRHLWRNPGAPRRETNCAGCIAHRYRRVRFASVRSERAHRDLALLQHGEGDAAVGAVVAPEPWPGRARYLAGLPFDPPHKPLRAPHPRAQREISVNRAVYRVATGRQKSEGRRKIFPGCASLSAHPQFEARLFRAYDASRLVVAPRSLRSEAELASRLA